jgi:hypothetical protein
MSQSLTIEILEMLLEAGEENIPTILNTVLARHPSDRPEALLEQTGQVLQELEGQRYAELAWYRGEWVPLSAAERARIVPIRNSVTWNTEAKRWQWKEADLGADRLLVILTEEGERHIRGVLRARSGHH